MVSFTDFFILRLHTLMSANNHYAHFMISLPLD